MKHRRPTLHVAQVAHVLGVTRARVQQLDGVLQPKTLARGVRSFDPTRVESYILDRIAAESKRLERLREILAEKEGSSRRLAE